MPVKDTYASIAKHAKACGHNRFCAPLAVSLLTGVHFDKVAHLLKAMGYRSNPKGGTSVGGTSAVIYKLGFNLIKVKLPKDIKTNITLAGRLNPKNKYIVRYSRHVAAYIDGKIEDWSDGKRNRVLDVYQVVPK